MPDLHRLGKPDVRAVGLERHRRALSRERKGKVVGVVGVIGPTRLNYARVVPMVDYHGASSHQIDGMNEGTIVTTRPKKSARKPRKTAPNWRNTTSSPSSRRSWRKRKKKALYAAAELQNVRRRTEKERAAGGDLCRHRVRARHAERERQPRPRAEPVSRRARARAKLKNFIDGIEATRANWIRSSAQRRRAGRSRRACRSTPTATRR